jgi:hypothetical protein
MSDTDREAEANREAASENNTNREQDTGAPKVNDPNRPDYDPNLPIYIPVANVVPAAKTYNTRSVAVEAFRWLGGELSKYGMPGWAGRMSSPDAGNLIVPMHHGGTEAARIGDWVVQHEDGTLQIMPHSTFVAHYDTGDEFEEPSNEQPQVSMSEEAKAAGQGRPRGMTGDTAGEEKH